MTRVLVAGSGVAAVECVLALHALAGAHLAIELLAPSAELVHRPMSVRTPFGGEPAPRIDLTQLAADLGIPLHRDSLASVEPETHHVLTKDGERLPYDVLVVATGARSQEAIPGAVTFRGPLSAGAVEHVIARVATAPELRVAFAAPAGARWLLPLYELALLSAATLRERGVTSPQLVVATGEHEPLEVLGPAAGEAVRAALVTAGVELVTSAVAEEAVTGALQLRSGEWLPADVVVALPELVGPRIVGLPQDEDGYIPVNEHGIVEGCADVYAAGDVISFPVKHGGLAAQQADAVAETIAARVGAIGLPEPFRPVLRGLLMTGGAPIYLRVELGPGGRREHRVLPATGTASTDALWWPPGKIAGRYLTPFLATRAASVAPLQDPAPADAPPAQGLDLILLVAEQDAASGDPASAVEALDDAEAWVGPLPPQASKRRDEWRRLLAR
jgi:sulfide:quinone oxidoreductase